MDLPPCPYLYSQLVAFRPLTRLSERLAGTVTRTWYCRHPFHGIEVELGEDPRAAVAACGACGLPRPEKGEGPQARDVPHEAHEAADLQGLVKP